MAKQIEMSANNFVTFLERMENAKGKEEALIELGKHIDAVYDLLKKLNRDGKLDGYK